MSNPAIPPRSDVAFGLLPASGTRRTFLASAGLGALSLAALAACGGSAPTAGSPTEGATSAAAGSHSCRLIGHH